MPAIDVSAINNLEGLNPRIGRPGRAVRRFSIISSAKPSIIIEGIYLTISKTVPKGESKQLLWK